MSEIEFIAMFSVFIGVVSGMIIFRILHDYCGWFK